MQVIKKLFLIIYIVFLGFIVFCNTSVFGADADIEAKYLFIEPVTTGFDDFFVNTQDTFDNHMIYDSGNGMKYANNVLTSLLKTNPNLNYYVDYVSDIRNYVSNYNDGYPAGLYGGYIIYLYYTSTTNNGINGDYQYGTIQDYYGGFYDNNQNFDNTLKFSFLKLHSFTRFAVYYNGNNSTIRVDSDITFNIPLACYNYHHNNFFNYLNSNNTNGASQISNAINTQTNTIKEESQKQQNAVATATQKQTNDLLDTNNTGNETMSVNDTTTDTSADLSSIYNNISSAFTTYDPTISWGKDFVFTLPNGDDFTINLDSSLILNFLDDYPVLKAFYQSIFWVIFGGYVIFDFKKIINKMKEGNIDNVVGTSSPVDSVVNMSLK